MWGADKNPFRKGCSECAELSCMFVGLAPSCLLPSPGACVSPPCAGFRGWGLSFLSTQDVPVKHEVLKMPTHHMELSAGSCVSLPTFWRAESGKHGCPGPTSFVGWKGPSQRCAVSNSLCHQAVKKVIRW